MAALIAILSAISGVALWKFTQVHKEPPFSSLLVLPNARVIADFRLTDHHSKVFSLTDLQSTWSLIFFGFTNCPDVCPGTLFELQKVNKNLQQNLQSEADQPQILFISVDPERDTPAKLKQYVAYFDPGFIGLTGDHSQLLPLTRQLGIAYRIDQQDPEEQDRGTPRYDVAHSASILLTDPQGRLYGVFPAPHDAEKIAVDLLALFKD